MKKKITRIIGVVSVFLLLMANSVSAQKFDGGTGTSADPYIISTAEHLNNVRTAVGAYYVIQNDIDLSEFQSGEGWQPISGFSGNMDGKGHTIKNLKINRPTANMQGLFAQIVPPGGEVSNLNVSGDVVGNSHSGGIAGQCFGIMSKCTFTGTVKGDVQHIGGICGMLMTQGPVRATVKNCMSNAIVSGSTKLGGITGFASDATVTNCFNTGKINQTTSMAGGIVGFNNNSNIINCYNEGEVVGKEDVGGIVGFSNPATCSIDKCYNAGNVEATVNAGGIIGKNAESIVSNCISLNSSVKGSSSLTGRIWGSSLGSTTGYTNNFALNTMKVNGNPVTGTDATSQNGSDKTLAEVRTLSTFQTNLGWDFTSDWAFITGFNPLLRDILTLPEPMFEGGKGIEAEPYIISKPVQLDNVRKAPQSCFIFQNDIDLSDYQTGEGWEPIAGFTGWIDGKGKTVKNLKINRPKSNDQGLFGRVITNSSQDLCRIENLSVIGDVIGKANVGGLIGTNHSANIKKCSFSGTVKGTEQVGGLVGSMSSDSSLPEDKRLSIVESYNHATVSTQGTGGGLVGQGFYIDISRCYNSGSISAQYGFIGGIVGSATGWNRGQGPGAEFGGTTISDCYNTGNIENGYKIGGIAGTCLVKKTAITRSYNTGNIKTDSDAGIVGGIAGSVNDATVSNCVAGNLELKGLNASRIAGEITGSAVLENNYALSSMQVNGKVVTDGGLTTVNGLDKTIKDLKLRTAYESGLSWNFTDVWAFVPGYFPMLNNVSEIPEELFAGGSGSSEDPYVIKNATHLNNVRKALDAHFIMEEDVDLSAYQEGEGWTPIAPANTTGFLGNFDGKGHKISNLKIKRSTNDGQSLFGYSKNSVIKNIVLENASVTGKNKVALIVSHAMDMEIDGCSVSGIADGLEYVSGIIAYSERNTLKNCTNKATVNGMAYVAGIAGLNAGNISDCSNEGKIESLTKDGSRYKYVGGISSYNHQGTVTRCGNEGEIISNTIFVGGIIGMSSEGVIDSCYNKGTVKGYEHVAGVCGVLDKGSIKDSYNTGQINAQINLGGVIGRTWLAKVTSCYNEGNIVGPEEDPIMGGVAAIGGVMGVNDQTETTLCYNKGNVSGFDFAGGIAGANTGKITKSYNTGNVKAVSEYAGGIAGTNNVFNQLDDTFISLCYNTGTIESGKTCAGGIAGVNSSRLINNYNTGLVKGTMANGGISGLCRTIGGGVVELKFCLNLGDIRGGNNNGGILGFNGYSGQPTFNVTAGQRVDGVESYRVVGGENTNNMNYIDNNLALETILVNGIRVNSSDPMSFDGKGVNIESLQSESTYEALGWDFFDVWYMTDGLSFPTLLWQPRLTTDIREKISVKKGETFTFTLGLEKQGFEIDPLKEVTWDYEKDKGITITSSDKLNYTVTGNVKASTVLNVALNGGNALTIPVEITDEVGIEENRIDNRLSVYPNPVNRNEVLTVDLRNADEPVKSVKLYDISSRMVQAVETVDNGMIYISTDKLSCGTYILQLVTESGRNITSNILVR